MTEILGDGEWSEELTEILKRAGIFAKLDEYSLVFRLYVHSSAIYEILCIGHDGQLGIRKVGETLVSGIVKAGIAE